MLLAAASGRLTWEQVVTGAVCSAQLEAELPQAKQQQRSGKGVTHVIACNACHAMGASTCGQTRTAVAHAGCWRCTSPGVQIQNVQK